MAKKKAKAKSDSSKDLSSIVDGLIKEVGDDRDRLVKFLDGLISEYEGEKSVGIAEYVAKLADALTRQQQVKAAVVKSLVRSTPSVGDDDELDVLQNEIGLPFEKDSDSGAN